MEALYSIKKRFLNSHHFSLDVGRFPSAEEMLAFHLKIYP